MGILELDSLSKDFGGIVAVDGFTFGLERGELHALVGPNGCGKSTLFNLITGAFPPSGGRVVFAGRDITGLPPYEISRLGIGRKFQVPAVFDELTVAENLAVPRWAGGRLSLWSAAVTAGPDDVLGRVGLGRRRDTRAGELAHGERQWLEIGMLLASRAQLLLLDEPTAGMTVAETTETARLIRGIAMGGDVTILVIEHDIGFIQRLDCPVTVMAKGRALRSGSYADIRADADVRELYFGRER
ncbi:MAG: ATP-binding cassette domain-containing protein [Alphaproteobacteria bacterium]